METFFYITMWFSIFTFFAILVIAILLEYYYPHIQYKSWFILTLWGMPFVFVLSLITVLVL